MIIRNIKYKIDNISESVDNKTALKNENAFYSILLFIAVFAGSIINFIVEYLYLNNPFRLVVRNSLILLMFAFLTLAISKFKNEILKMYLYAFEVSLILVFCYYEFYSSIGPSVNTVGFLFLVTILIYSRIEILLVYFVSFLILLITSSKELRTFNNWKGYSISEIVILVMVMVATLFVYNVYKSRQKRIEYQYNELLLSREKLYATLIAVGDGVISINDKGEVDYMNPVAEKLTGWNQMDAKGEVYEKVFRVFNEGTGDKIESLIQKVLSKQSSMDRSDHIFMVGKDDLKRFIENTVSPIKGKNDDVVGVLLVFKDVTIQRERRKEIEFLSYCDALTSLYNRRYFENVISRLDIESNWPLSFLYADVNGLKIINDTFGHEAGDELIKKVADSLKSSCRSDDVASRIGGDEFVMIYPRTSMPKARSIVKEIEEKLNREKIRNIDISVSFGIGVKEFSEQNVFEILKSAEDSMYNIKMRESDSRKNAVIESLYISLIENNEFEKRHSIAVASISGQMAELLGFEKDAIEEIKLAGKFHDIGKITADRSIYLKEGELTEIEWSSIIQHSEVGYRLLSTSREHYNLAKYIRYHHEKWDGTGYPKKLKSLEIPVESRLIAIADAYDFMISDKPYGKSLTIDEAIIEIKQNAGTHFDPELVKVFVEKWVTKYGNA